MDTDYPAAHSGDVNWFAVDAEGNVGVFLAEEDSGIPYIGPEERKRVREAVDNDEVRAALAEREREAERGESSEDETLWKHLAYESSVIWDEIKEMTLVDVGFDVEACLHIWNGDWHGWFDVPLQADSIGPCLVWVTDPSCLVTELNSGAARLPPQRRTGLPAVIAFADLSGETARRLVLSGHCLGIHPYREPFQISMSARAEWTRLGLHVYSIVERLSSPILSDAEQTKYEFGAHQYLRDLYPLRRLSIDLLSERARRIVGRARFPLKFSDAPFLQPELYFPCRRDLSTRKLVEHDGTPTPLLLSLNAYHQHLAWLRSERDVEIRRGMDKAMSGDDGFPAAHSADTAWFAVDVEGNVGIFETGEQGTIPKSWREMPAHLIEADAARMKSEIALCGTYVDRHRYVLLEMVRHSPGIVTANLDMLAALRQEWEADVHYLARCVDAAWITGLGPRPEAHTPNLVPWYDPDWTWPPLDPMFAGGDAGEYVMVLDTNYALNTGYVAEQVFSDGQHRVLIVREMPVELLQRIHADRACYGCFQLADHPHRAGVFRFEFALERREYQRAGAPVVPLHIDGQAPITREFLTVTTLHNVHFQTASRIAIEDDA